MVMCFAPDCKHYSERDGCKFFLFPKEPVERKRWLMLIRRADRDPSNYSLVCSCHFVNGEKKNGPTLYEHNKMKAFQGLSPEKKKKRVSKTATSLPSTSSAHTVLTAPAEQSNAEISITDLITEVATPSVPSVTEEFSSINISSCSDAKEVAAPATTSSAVLDAENYFLRQEISGLQDKLNRAVCTFTFEQIEQDDSKISKFTGLPNAYIFNTLFDLLKNIKLRYYYGWTAVGISKKDQLLMTLMKLKLNLLQDDLGVRFNVSHTTVSHITLTWLHLLHQVLFTELMAEIPSKEKNKCCLPSCFSSFTNCRIILDCTEITTVVPKSMETQKATYSSYKHRNTLKGLVGVAPNGVVTYVSDLYPGSTSDKQIVAHCGILKKFVAGDLVLADKGFLIGDLLPQGVSLNIPPFLTTTQFTPQQVLRTRTIAKARIHVERAIKRIKGFDILCKIPASLIPQSSIIFQVCGALTNLQYPLIREVEDLY